VIVPTEARHALDRYFKERDKQCGSKGALFCTRKGGRLSRTQVDRALKQIAAQASAKLPPEERVRFSAHVLRHTFLRKLARKKGVEFAMEAAGHCSSQYIWRYVKPSEEEKAVAVEGLF
jgi:integrase/recombinase XerD